MTTPHTWTFDNGPIRSITADPGRIVVKNKGAQQMTITRKGEGHLLGFALMAQGLREEIAALLAAYRIAWPDPVQPPDSIVVGLNIDIDEVAP
jgi:hypothetical protein